MAGIKVKRVFFILLFINVVYFLWSQLGTAERVNEELIAPLYNSNSIEELSLVQAKEIDKLEKRAADKQDRERLKQVVAEKAFECYLLGDFSNSNDATLLVKKFINLTSETSVVPIKPETEYWVIYPAGKTWEASRKNVDMLKSKNEVDIWLVPKGRNKGIISLGLYAKENRANIRLQALLDKEIKAKITTRVKNRYSVRVKIIGGLDRLKSYLEKENIEERGGISKISC